MSHRILLAFLIVCLTAGSSAAGPGEKTLHHKAHRKTTLYEKYQKRRECALSPSQCDVEFFNLDIRKTVKEPLDPNTDLSTEFCIGGCAVDSVLQWTLQWH